MIPSPAWLRRRIAAPTLDWLSESISRGRVDGLCIENFSVWVASGQERAAIEAFLGEARAQTRRRARGWQLAAAGVAAAVASAVLIVGAALVGAVS